MGKPSIIKPTPKKKVNGTTTKKAVGCESYRSFISKYDWNVTIMMAIMQAESGCSTTRVGDNYPIAGLYAPSCGLLQIRTLKGRPSCEALKNPATNVEWAYKIYKSSLDNPYIRNGYIPWSVYTNGNYRRYL